MALELFKNNIIFAFMDDTASNGVFKDKTDWGFEIGALNHSKQSQEGRWGKVIACGPECKEVVNGSVIFIEPLMWTSNFEFDGVKLWKTDESKAMLIDGNYPTRSETITQ